MIFLLGRPVKNRLDCRITIKKKKNHKTKNIVNTFLSLIYSEYNILHMILFLFFFFNCSFKCFCQSKMSGHEKKIVNSTMSTVFRQATSEHWYRYAYKKKYQSKKVYFN